MVCFLFLELFLILKERDIKFLKQKLEMVLGKVGEVLSDKLEIACNNNQSIKILEIQRQGKKTTKNW